LIFSFIVIIFIIVVIFFTAARSVVVGKRELCRTNTEAWRHSVRCCKLCLGMYSSCRRSETLRLLLSVHWEFLCLLHIMGCMSI